MTEVVHQSRSECDVINRQDGPRKGYGSENLEDRWGGYEGNGGGLKNSSDGTNCDGVSGSVGGKTKGGQGSFREIVDLSMPRCNNDSGAYRGGSVNADPNCLDFNPSVLGVDPRAGSDADS